MSVVIETTLGDVTVDLYLNERPRACLNFLKLCKVKYYNFNLFHTISRGFIAQTGDPTGSRTGGESVFGVIDGPSKRYFEAENEPRIKHTRPGLISFVGGDKNMIGSQFFLTLGEDLTYLDEKHCVFGEVVEGVDILEAINEVICDNDNRPYQDVRITHTVVLDDPFPDPKRLLVPTRSPSPSAERLAGGRIAPDEEIDETSGRSVQEIAEMQAEREAKARATILEMVGDIPDAEMAPPENVLFVCKLNPVTTDDDLEIIFSRFGKIKFCEVIRDRKSGDSLQYAFIEFEEQKSCEDAYFKMGNVLIDDRRIHVDFSQSVSKVKWLGKGRGVAHYDEKGNKRMNDANNDVGKGNYKINNGYSNNKRGGQQNDSSRREKRSPDRDSRQRKNSPRRNRNRSRSTTRESHRGRSPQGSRKNSPRRNRTRDSYRGRSPQGNRKSMYSRDRRATDFRRRRSPSPIARRRSRSPINRKRFSRSPQVSLRRHDRRSSSRNRPRSPRRSSSQNRQKHFSGRSPIKSKRDASREKSKSVEKYKHSSREKSLLTEKYKEEPIRSHKRSESSENKRSLVHREDSSSKRSSRRSASVQESSSLKNRDSTVSPKRSNKERSSESISKEKPKGKSSTTKKKKSKLDNSSDDSDSDSEEEKLKKKKINESDSSSSSEEEKAKSKFKHHKNKKAVKVKKSKKSKKRRKKHSSSSSGSGSNSSENSSDSSGDRHKPKKKKSKKSSDESD